MPTTLTKQDFWTKIDEFKLEQKLETDSRIQIFQNIPINLLIEILEQYSEVTRIHAKSLNFVLKHLSGGRLKKLLQEIFEEETGNGDPTKTHHNLLKNFLHEIDQKLGGDKLTNKINPKITALINAYELNLRSHSPHIAIGMAGMGSECICGPILEEMWKRIKKRKDLINILPLIDTEFWTIHTGEIDQSHAYRMREAIDLEIAENQELASEVLIGYKIAVDFWESILDIFEEMAIIDSIPF